jgi:hypothetical protein
VLEPEDWIPNSFTGDDPVAVVYISSLHSVFRLIFSSSICSLRSGGFFSKILRVFFVSSSLVVLTLPDYIIRKILGDLYRKKGKKTLTTPAK